MKLITLSAISIYPIKSTAGITLSNSWVDDYGLSFDRRFVITDPTGEFISARTEPSLCLIQASITPNGLVITAPGMPLLEINYKDFSTDYQPVRVWQDTINSLHCAENIDLWFSQYLKRPCKLHFFAHNSSRYVKNSHKEVSFADGYPLLLISQASLNDLNHRLDDLAQAKVAMSQFRPNLVVDNTEAFAEDTWRHIRIGEVEFELVKPCSRCIMTTVDPSTGEKHPKQQPLNTLKEFRQVKSGDVMFGQNLIALNKGQIHLGDEVTILDSQPSPTFIHKVTKSSVTKQTAPSKKPRRTKRAVTILFDSWDKQVKGNTKDLILDQGEQAGLILPYSCRAGMCGRCKIKVDSGQVKQLADDGLTEEEKQQGYVLACSAIPESDLILSKPD
ncbi:YcbX family protein [Thalassotalea piscium]